MGSLLRQMSLPIMALRYPTTLNHLEVEASRVRKSSDELRTVMNSYPNLKSINKRNIDSVRTLIVSCPEAFPDSPDEEEEDTGFGLFD